MSFRSNGLFHDENNEVDRALLASLEKYDILWSELDPSDPDYKQKINILKKEEAQERIKIQHDAAGGSTALTIEFLFWSFCFLLSYFAQ